MVRIAMIRHGPTEWNDIRRIQGQTDIPLSARGRRLVSTWSVPAEFDDFDWIVSPLQRAIETARILTSTKIIPEPALKEMHWGQWQGQTIEDIRKLRPHQLNQNEARGIDFEPPGGESPRLVQRRLSRWFSDVRNRNRSVVAVTHKGVIRATYALATGWNMISDPAVELNWCCAHVFQLDDNALPSLLHLNIPLSNYDWSMSSGI